MATHRPREIEEPLPRFIKSAAKVSQCPQGVAREVAFIGRSNVGKSSLLGALLDQDTLVRRSRTPGRTQLINFFESKEHEIFVDLPGYGYAEVPGRVKAELDDLIQSYLRDRDPLQLVLLLLDARREEPTALDRAHFDFALQHGRRVLCVATKIDRLTKAQRKPTYKKIANALGLPAEDLLPVSAEENEGLKELRQHLRAEAKS